MPPAAEDASDLPSTWRDDDQGATLGPQHNGIGFFPTILGISTADSLPLPGYACDQAPSAMKEMSTALDWDLDRYGIRALNSRRAPEHLFYFFPRPGHPARVSRLTEGT